MSLFAYFQKLITISGKTIALSKKYNWNDVWNVFIDGIKFS